MKQIYVHGLGQTSNSWTKTIDILQTTDYSLCPNLPDLVHSKEVTYDNLYAAFSDYCNQYDEPIDLCGLSLGGVLALNYAIQYPKKVRSLVLIATQYKMPKKLLKFQNLLFRFMPKSMFQQMGFRKADFLLLCETMMELDFNNSLHKISCPTLLLYGEKDTANKNASIELAELLKNVELKTIIGIGEKYRRNNERRTPRNEEGLTQKQAQLKEEENKVKELRKEGLSMSKIAKELGISKSKVVKLANL